MKGSMAIRLGLAIAALLTAGFAGAQAPSGGPGFGDNRPPMERAFGDRGDHGRWWNDPAMVERLKLTDEQRKAMDAILLQHREKLIDLHASLDKAELAMEPLMREDQPNESAILAQIDKVAQARAELEKANARYLLGIRGKLTPDQWKTLQAGRMNRMEHRQWDRQEGNRLGGDGQHAGRPPEGMHHRMDNGGAPPPPAGTPGAPPPPTNQ
jgi:protein CpxP